MSTLSAQHRDSKVKKDLYCIEEFYFRRWYGAHYNVISDYCNQGKPVNQSLFVYRTRLRFKEIQYVN